MPEIFVYAFKFFNHSSTFLTCAQMKSGKGSILSKTAHFLETKMLTSVGGALNVLSHCAPVADIAEKSGIIAQAVSSAIDHFEKCHFAVTPLTDRERELIKAIPRLDWLVQLVSGLKLHAGSGSLVCTLISAYISARQNILDICDERKNSCAVETDAPVKDSAHRHSSLLTCNSPSSGLCQEDADLLDATIPLLPSHAPVERHFSASLLTSMLRFAFLNNVSCLPRLVKLCGRAFLQFPTAELQSLPPSLFLQLVNELPALASPPCMVEACHTIDRYLLHADVQISDFIRLVKAGKPRSRECHDDLLQALRLIATRATQQAEQASKDSPPSRLQERKLLDEAVALVDFTKLSENSLLRLAEQSDRDAASLPVDGLLQRAVKALVDMQQHRRGDPAPGATDGKPNRHSSPLGATCAIPRQTRMLKQLQRKRHSSGPVLLVLDTSSAELDCASSSSTTECLAPHSKQTLKRVTPSSRSSSSPRLPPPQSSTLTQPSERDLVRARRLSAEFGSLATGSSSLTLSPLTTRRQLADAPRSAGRPDVVRDYGVNLAHHSRSGSDLTSANQPRRTEHIFLLWWSSSSISDDCEDQFLHQGSKEPAANDGLQHKKK